MCAHAFMPGCVCALLTVTVHACACVCAPFATQLPAKSLYEYCFDVEEGVWKAWKAYVTPYEPPIDGQFSKILVPTVDVVRYAHAAHACVRAVCVACMHTACSMVLLQCTIVCTSRRVLLFWGREAALGAVC